MKNFLLMFALLLSAALAPALAQEPLGVKPAHIFGSPSTTEIEAAVGTKIWAPGIDQGYVPQGLTFADGQVLLSTYRSTDPKVDRGPCRIFRIDPASGATTGQFDMSQTCGHAGGLVYLGGGVLIVADTRVLYKIDMRRAFADGNTVNALLGRLLLAGEMKGSLIDSDGSLLFIGSSEKNPAMAKGFFLPLSLFDTHDGQTLGPESVVRSFPIAAEAQGAAFDGSGALWLTASNSKFGRLQKLDPISGNVQSQHDVIIGIEDIGFDPQGKLWAVSETGSLRWARWSKTFPVIFQIDVNKLP